ncbi:acyltransferase family protein [Pelagibacterium sp. H642]|uniref:acyltransferase family protein n=1 Tax=Pelagibacterium sp. H642 TaxID=1881069 RepID=UPI002814DA74|nr:acyltransferase family protein [Pelagibacterium sp. H642]WMT90035.1 acyltransferase family protein [Pelagibacterium sp. H642]
MTGSAEKRHAWVDVAKGISIILVVMMHSTYGVGEATERVGFMHYVLGFATPFRMPEFFLVSGLFLSAVIARPWLHFADRRVVHYLYFYALWAVILIGFKHLLIDRDPAGAAALLASAIYEPYSILWFIYALAVYGLIAKLLYHLRAPHIPVLIVAAAVSIAPIATPVSIVNYVAEYFVYFYAGYALAPAIFDFAGKVEARPGLALLGLAAWAVLNAVLVFSPGHSVTYGVVTSGAAHIPGANFVMAMAGALAICAASVLLARLAGFHWLRWIGAHSIVIYLSFVIPMGSFRTVLLAVMPNIDAGLASLATLIVSVVSPIIVYWIISRIGFGKFLFERPSWAHLPGAPGSRWAGRPVPAPAE